MPESVAVVMPAYHSATEAPSVIAGVRRAVPGAVVVLVDDGSADGTAEAAEAAGARVIRLHRNRGKGRALGAGLDSVAADNGVRFVVTLDADGQHPPEQIPALLAPLERGEADVVVGARSREAGVMPAGRRMTNWLSSTLLSRAVGFDVPDSQSGFRAMTREVAATMRPRGARYEYETEFLFEAAERGMRIVAVSVPTVYQGARSHFRHFRDTLAIAGVFLRHWRRILAGPRRSP